MEGHILAEAQLMGSYQRKKPRMDTDKTKRQNELHSDGLLFETRERITYDRHHRMVGRAPDSRRRSGDEPCFLSEPVDLFSVPLFQSPVGESEIGRRARNQIPNIPRKPNGLLLADRKFNRSPEGSLAGVRR